MTVFINKEGVWKFRLDNIYHNALNFAIVVFLPLSTTQGLERSECGAGSLLYSQPVSLWQDWDLLWLGSEWQKKPCNFLPEISWY